MNELSLHILDICQNSIKANASLIQIIVNEQPQENIFEIIIKDNGSGMSAKTLSEVADPFFTTRTTRKVGLGVSLFKMAAEMAEGSFNIESKLNEGTSIDALFKYNHLDRAPLGNIAETISILVLNEAEIDIHYIHKLNTKVYNFDTREIKEVLDGIPFTNYEVITWIKNNIKEGILDIHKEET
ncbi:Histidine protein kinase DivJ [Candidatus Izimaplasma bacterium HR1]|jgi:hypothetical protein|uniref:ATP-binding protein n=1 Tax=Candidatus Izimoplasma sp. HR1 TaxID=1541959 RepID=UPI0004F5A7F7|nr:Histidine protein kinase DivJ [Candidatus Izimaplasma bacterium HR1]